MAISYREGETKVRPGLYQRQENVDQNTNILARDGICAIPIKASWGPLGKVLKNSNKVELKNNYGDGEYSADFTVPAAAEMFNGGAVTVYTYRLGTGGTAATAAFTEGLTATAKYPGKVSISVAVQNKLVDSTKKEFLVYFGNSLVESIDFKADTTAEGQNLIDAVAKKSKYVNVTVTPDGTAPTTVPIVQVASGALSGGADPTVQNDDYSKAFAALEPYYYNTIALDVDDDESTTKSLLLKSYISNAAELGKTCIGVVGEKVTVDFEDRLEHCRAFNTERIAYLGGGYMAGTDSFDGALSICRTAGYIASTPSNQSIVHKVIDGATELCETLTNAQYEEAINSGMLLLSMSADGSIWYDSGVNTLTVLDDDTQDAGWKKIKRTKVRHEAFDRIDRALAPKVGKVNPLSDGVADVIQSAQRVLDAMVNESKMYPGASFVEDPDRPVDADSAWFIIDTVDVDTLEKIYLTYRFHYSQNQ